MSMPTLPTLIAAVQDYVGVVTGIRTAPDAPPDQIAGGGVCALVYPASGAIRDLAAGGLLEGQHTLHLMLATPRVNLRSDWARVIALGDTVTRALLGANTMSGVLVMITECRYTFGDLEWGGQQLFGWLFELDTLLAGSAS